MKILVFGSRGFIGRAIRETLSLHHEVYGTVHSQEIKTGELRVDLTDSQSIETVLRQVAPDIIVNAAGIVDVSKDITLNEVYTKNILNSVLAVGLDLKRIIICGSASEYGNIEDDDLPVNENVALRATAGYGLAKANEERAALEFRYEHNLPVIVVRIFNPLGKDMAEKFLTSRLKKQFAEYQAGKREAIEISRQDSQRDYVDVRDVARAVQMIIEGNPRQSVYNIGSGTSTTNGELLQLMLNNSNIEDSPHIVETATDPEPLVAVRADITRLEEEFHWKPTYLITDTVREIMND